jgi:hypothetical protein
MLAYPVIMITFVSGWTVGYGLEQFQAFNPGNFQVQQDQVVGLAVNLFQGFITGQSLIDIEILFHQAFANVVVHGHFIVDDQDSGIHQMAREFDNLGVALGLRGGHLRL